MSDFCTKLKAAIEAATDPTIKAILQAIYDNAGCGTVTTDETGGEGGEPPH